MARRPGLETPPRRSGCATRWSASWSSSTPEPHGRDSHGTVEAETRRPSVDRWRCTVLTWSASTTCRRIGGDHRSLTNGHAGRGGGRARPRSERQLDRHVIQEKVKDVSPLPGLRCGWKPDSGALSCFPPVIYRPRSRRRHRVAQRRAGRRGTPRLSRSGKFHRQRGRGGATSQPFVSSVVARLRSHVHATSVRTWTDTSAAPGDSCTYNVRAQPRGRKPSAPVVASSPSLRNERCAASDAVAIVVQSRPAGAAVAAAKPLPTVRAGDDYRARRARSATSR